MWSSAAMSTSANSPITMDSSLEQFVPALNPSQIPMVMSMDLVVTLLPTVGLAIVLNRGSGFIS